jgi:hypothetical protein
MWELRDELFHAGVQLIDVFTAALIAGYVAAALWELLSGASIEQARLIVAEGAVFGLSFKVAATLLNALDLQSWNHILMFAAVLALRTTLKQLFVWEQRHVLAGMAGGGTEFL